MAAHCLPHLLVQCRAAMLHRGSGPGISPDRLYTVGLGLGLGCPDSNLFPKLPFSTCMKGVSLPVNFSHRCFVQAPGTSAHCQLQKKFCCSRLSIPFMSLCFCLQCASARISLPKVPLGSWLLTLGKLHSAFFHGLPRDLGPAVPEPTVTDPIEDDAILLLLNSLIYQPSITSTVFQVLALLVHFHMVLAVPTSLLLTLHTFPVSSSLADFLLTSSFSLTLICSRVTQISQCEYGRLSVSQRDGSVSQTNATSPNPPAALFIKLFTVCCHSMLMSLPWKTEVY